MFVWLFAIENNKSANSFRSFCIEAIVPSYPQNKHKNRQTDKGTNGQTGLKWDIKSRLEWQENSHFLFVAFITKWDEINEGILIMKP